MKLIKIKINNSNNNNNKRWDKMNQIRIKIPSSINFYNLSNKSNLREKLYNQSLNSLKKIKIRMVISISSTPWPISEPEITNLRKCSGSLSNSKQEESHPHSQLPLVVLLLFKLSSLSNTLEAALLKQ